MIRMVLFALGFAVVTVALVLFQPGNGRQANTRPDASAEVTRAVPALGPALPEQPALAARAPVETAPRPPVPPAPQAGQTALDDQSLRRMTWDTLSNLNHATGRETAPGQPGSLLHTIVRRSLDEPAVPQRVTARAEAKVYVVQKGDSLVAIAERVYGDVNMTGPLFAANQAILARPDDLREGQTLVLPER